MICASVFNAAPEKRSHPRGRLKNFHEFDVGEQEGARRTDGETRLWDRNEVHVIVVPRLFLSTV